MQLKEESGGSIVFLEAYVNISLLARMTWFVFDILLLLLVLFYGSVCFYYVGTCSLIRLECWLESSLSKDDELCKCVTLQSNCTVI